MMGSLMIPINDVLLLQLQQLAKKHGHDVETEAQILLMQSMQVQMNTAKKTPLDFAESCTDKTETPHAKAGGWEGKIWMADDFDAPLDDFAEYM